jgi:hypothetical protein
MRVMNRQGNIRNYSTSKSSDEARRKMLARINIEFPKLRPDLRHSPEELRLERLVFCEKVLSLRSPLDSMRRLTNVQLGKVIEAIKREMPQGNLPGCGVHHFKKQAVACGVEQLGGGSVIHLAGKEQTWAIEKLFEYLGWTNQGCEHFLKNKYNRITPKLLAPKQANSCLMILFNIAASRDLKAKHGQDKHISRTMIHAYIPELKRKLGIDQGVQ